jgi:hypothetical protein
VIELQMVDPRPAHSWMTQETFAGPASSGLPLQSAKAAPCVLDQLDFLRPQDYAGQESTI